MGDHGVFQRKLTSRTLGSSPLGKKKRAVPIKLHRLKKMMWLKKYFLSIEALLNSLSFV